MKKIYFRADGNSQIGLGHVIRSLALVDMLKEEFDCHFIIQNPFPDLVTQILSVCNGIIKLSTSPINEVEAKSIVDTYLTKVDIIILDGYQFKTPYQQVLKNYGCKVICIDDIYSYHFVADAIINHAGGMKKSNYSAETYTRFYLGLKYALLRPPFLKAAQSIRTTIEQNNTFICLGGADPANDTLNILKKCEEKSPNGIYYVIVGSANPHKKALFNFEKKTKLTIKFLFNLSAIEMVAVMKKCGQAITSPSTISFEYLCTGGQLFLKKIAANQKDVYKYLTQSKIAYPLKDFFLNKSFKNRAPVIDGKQKRRFLNLVNNLFIKFEKAKIVHCDLYYKWANEPETRKQSLHSDPIPIETHINWFKKKLKEEHTIMLLGMLDQTPIGQVRLEINQQEGLINYSVAPNFRGKGIGAILLQQTISYIISNNVSIHKLIGFVKGGNLASLHIFRKLDFQEEMTTKDQKTLHRFELLIDQVVK